jgi:hypothetical protein
MIQTAEQMVRSVVFSLPPSDAGSTRVINALAAAVDAREHQIRDDEREAILRLLPGGQTCDPQEIADAIRARGDVA